MNRSNRTTIILVAIIAILATILLRNNIQGKKSELDSSIVLNKIVNIQELSLVKYNYGGVIGYKDTMKVMNFNVPFTEKHFLLKYNGYVKAGIDLSGSQIKTVGKSIEIAIPKPQIVEIVIDEKSIKVYGESNNPFNPTSIADYNHVIVKEKETMKRDAVKQGILKDASRQSRLILTEMLREMGFNKITINEVPSITLPERE